MNQFDMACPKCGDEDHIDVAAVVWVRLTDDGTDLDAPKDGSHEWDDNSEAQCVACDYSGKVRDFEPHETAYVVVDYDPDPDFSFLEQDCFKGEDPADHIQLVMTAYDGTGNITDSLSCIDFYAASDDWKTGTFHNLGQLKGMEHLQETARDMGLPE